MKKLILALMLTTIASSAFADIITIKNKGWYSADVTITGANGAYAKRPELLLGQSWTAEVPSEWTVHVIINGSRESWWTYDRFEFTESGYDDVKLELHGTVFKPSLRKVN